MVNAMDILVKEALLPYYDIIEKIEQERITTIYKALHKSSNRLVLLKIIPNLLSCSSYFIHPLFLSLVFLFLANLVYLAVHYLLSIWLFLPIWRC